MVGADSAITPILGMRGHARELFAVQLLDTRTGEVARKQIVAEGAGWTITLVRWLTLTHDRHGRRRPVPAR